jgi:hypothetical protein
VADGRELEDLKIRNIFFCCLLLKSIKMAKMFLFRGTNELIGLLVAAKLYRTIARSYFESYSELAK